MGYIAVMKTLNPNNQIYTPVLRDFKRWAKEQKFIHSPGMVGQTEYHFPCKATYAAAVYCHDHERWSRIRVMQGPEWHLIELP